MNTRQLEYIITVAEEGSISKAAKKLFISQPSLSQYIQKLEQELGAELFKRSSPLQLTYEGKIYVKMARKILYEENVMKQTLFDIVHDKAGEITIGAGQFNSTCILPCIVQNFQEKYPYIKVIMKDEIELLLFEMLNKNECDLIFTTMEPENDMDQYEIINLSKEEYLLAVPSSLDPVGTEYKDNIKNTADNVFPNMDIKTFKDLPFIFIENRNIILHTIMEKICAMEKIKPVTQIECANITVVLHLVAAGAGVSFVPSSAVLFNMGDDIHFYSIKQVGNNRKLNLIYEKNKYLTKNAKYFIEISRQIFNIRKRL